MNWTVRDFTRADVPQLLELMRGLARFEHYIDGFAVTEADIVERGLGPDPQFFAKVAVAEDGVTLLGMAVGYIIPYTYNLKPNIVLKELFVSDGARSMGIGEGLMRAMARHAVSIGAGSLRWTVMPDNDPAKRFYAGLGGRPDDAWQPWIMDANALAALASSDGRDS